MRPLSGRLLEETSQTPPPKAREPRNASSVAPSNSMASNGRSSRPSGARLFPSCTSLLTRMVYWLPVMVYCECLGDSSEACDTVATLFRLASSKVQQPRTHFFPSHAWLGSNSFGMKRSQSLRHIQVAAGHRDRCVPSSTHRYHRIRRGHIIERMKAVSSGEVSRVKVEDVLD